MVIDMLNDFAHPNGALYVKGGELVGLINRAMPFYDIVVGVQDWHPREHLSSLSGKTNRVMFLNILTRNCAQSAVQKPMTPT